MPTCSKAPRDKTPDFHCTIMLEPFQLKPSMKPQSSWDILNTFIKGASCFEIEPLATFFLIEENVSGDTHT